MLTLRELRNMVEVAEVEGRVPSVKALLGAKVPIIVKELLSEQAEISVYQNGFVLYRVGKRATVFPLHSCKEYIYDSNIEALTNINERFFDNENWYIRLILEGEDRLVKNQEVRNGKKTISYSAVAEDWNELRGGRFYISSSDFVRNNGRSIVVVDRESKICNKAALSG